MKKLKLKLLSLAVIGCIALNGTTVFAKPSSGSFRSSSKSSSSFKSSSSKSSNSSKSSSKASSSSKSNSKTINKPTETPKAVSPVKPKTESKKSSTANKSANNNKTSSNTKKKTVSNIKNVTNVNNTYVNSNGVRYNRSFWDNYFLYRILTDHNDTVIVAADGTKEVISYGYSGVWRDILTIFVIIGVAVIIIVIIKRK